MAQAPDQALHVLDAHGCVYRVEPQQVVTNLANVIRNTGPRLVMLDIHEVVCFKRVCWSTGGPCADGAWC